MTMRDRFFPFKTKAVPRLITIRKNTYIGHDKMTKKTGIIILFSLIFALLLFHPFNVLPLDEKTTPKDYRFNLYIARGELSLADNYHDTAIENFKLAISYSPTFAEAYYNLGLIYIERRKFEDAITKFETAIDNEPFYADAYSSLGVCYYHLKDSEEAMKLWIMAIEIDPTLGKAHNNLAIAYHTAGKYDLAWEHVLAAQRSRFTVHPEFIERLKNDSQRNHRN